MGKLTQINSSGNQFLDEVFSNSIGSHENGWSFATGDPEIYQNLDKLLIPGGKAIDLGMGSARTSLCLAMNGMNVVGYDTDMEDVDFINELSKAYSLPLESRLADILKTNIGTEKYDTAILSQTFVHSESKEDAFKIVKKGINSLKIGGYMYLRTIGKRDHGYDDLTEFSRRWGLDKHSTDPDIIYSFCGCSGETKIEPHLFLSEAEIMTFLGINGMRISYSQVAPSIGKVNVMYGENWHTDGIPGEIYQMLTLIAKRIR